MICPPILYYPGVLYKLVLLKSGFLRSLRLLTTNGVGGGGDGEWRFVPVVFGVYVCVCVCLYTGVLCYILGMGWDVFGSFSFSFPGCGLTMSGWFFGFRY